MLRAPQACAVVLAFAGVASSSCAPSATPQARATAGGQSASPYAGTPAGDLEACALPWKLEQVLGDSSSVVVVCGTDVRREPLGSARELAQAIAPAMEPARARVCSCAARLRVPPFIDLVVTAVPDEGLAMVQASDPEGELDEEIGPAFVACVGTVIAPVARSNGAAVCHGAGKASFSYPVRVELAR